MFYTYLWLREDGTPYYAGKGKGKRAWRKGSPPAERVVVYPAASEDDAFETEVALIWYYGRKDLGLGFLRNYTNGGEGQSGRPVSEDTRAKIGNANKGRPVSEEIVKERSERQLRRCANPEELQRMKERALRTWDDPELHKQRSDSQRSLWGDPEYRAKMAQKRKEQGLNIRKTFCLRGHERTTENLYGRSCKICKAQNRKKNASF